MAIEFQQIYRAAETKVADALLDEAERRLEAAKKDSRWRHVVGLQDTGDQQLLVGGYLSKIDGSYQPYAVVIPEGFQRQDARPRRLDIWFHGRGEKLSEVSFLDKGRKSAGQYTPRDTFVLHPYGRYSNAFKFAGEIDVLEALGHVRRQLPVDPQRVSVRGFSMGGAACWQFATHYPGAFFAANPGAGFSETPEFLKSFQGEDVSATPEYQRVLWSLYDCPPWSRNLMHCPTVAYSGEIDRQKQAADVMAAALKSRDMDLIHIIGPNTAHKIHPDSKIEIERRMDAIACSIRPETPRQIDFTTFTLRYNQMRWVDIQGLEKHWSEARVRASLNSATDDSDDYSLVTVETQNVDGLRLAFDAGEWNGRFPCRPVVIIDGVELVGPPIRSDRSWTCDLTKSDGTWVVGNAAGLRKRPGLQGPIDDAFMDSFVFVEPGLSSSDPAAQNWFSAETEHARTHWKKHFRGDVRSVLDAQITDEHVARSNLIVFGDPSSNAVLKAIGDRLPIVWNEDSIVIGKSTFPSEGHVVAMIYPNPLNPDKYVVLNSGFTFREYDYLNNARQTPKLPDWAVIDVRGGSTSRNPGKVVAAGFFNESWSLE